MRDQRKRSGLTIMRRLIVLISPLKFNMVLAVAAGSLSFLCATGLAWGTAVWTARLIASGSPEAGRDLLPWLIAAIVCRGLMRYLEQYMNHLIAFKVLAVMRGKVFGALRRLAPSSLIHQNKGDLLSMIAGDMELLEVFYAHTISPISIAAVTGIIYTVCFSLMDLRLGLTALLSYLLIAVLLPLLFARFSKHAAMGLRASIGELNNKYLDSLRGLLEIIQFAYEERARKKIIKVNARLAKEQSKMIGQLGLLLGLIDAASLAAAAVFVGVGLAAGLPALRLMAGTAAFFFSFGAVSAVALLGSGLAQTLACGDRILDLLDAEPLTEAVTGKQDLVLDPGSEAPIITVSHVDFGYGEQNILEDVSLEIEQGELLGLQGPSGCGKSTLLKLLMRFWTCGRGEILIQGQNINEINTESLWDHIAYMTQTTEFFDGTIRDNLLIAKADADDRALYEALAKASLASYVRSLPQGLDSEMAELGDNFSGGERQRIGLARVFLADRPILLLDEPSSNLDSLNEGIILDAVRRHMKDKTIILVSHRESTLRICGRVLQMADLNHAEPRASGDAL